MGEGGEVEGKSGEGVKKEEADDEASQRRSHAFSQFPRRVQEKKARNPVMG